MEHRLSFKLLYKYFQMAILGAVAIFLIFFIINHIYEIKKTLSQIRFMWIFPLVLLLSIASLIRAIAWSRLIQSIGCNLPLKHLVAIWHYSLGGKYIPGSVWMIAGRVYQLKTAGVPVKIAIYSSGLEQIVCLAASIFLVLVTPEVYQILEIPSWIGIFIFPCALIVLNPHFIGDILWKISLHRIDLRFSPNPKGIKIIEMTFLNICASIIVGLGVLTMLKVFNTEGNGINILNASGINAAGFVVGYLSFLTPSGLGVREGVFSYFLSLYLSTTASVVIGFSLRIWMVLSDLLGIIVSAVYLSLSYD